MLLPQTRRIQKSLKKDASLLFDFQKTGANMLISVKSNFSLRQQFIDPSRQIDSNKDKTIVNLS